MDGEEMIITTKHGPIVVRLRPDKAPKHCEFVRCTARSNPKNRFQKPAEGLASRRGFATARQIYADR